MSLKLYANMLSQPSRAVKLFLLATKIPFEDKNVNLAKGEHLTEEYLQMNPFHKVPIIDDNGFVLRESIGILRYLSRERDIPEHWYPKDSKKQAKVDEYLEWQHLDTRMNCSAYFLCKYLNPMITGKEPNPDKIKECEKRMKGTLDLIENIWLKDKPYLVGDTISVADIVGACELEQPRMAGYDPRKDYPKIRDWLERVRQDLNPHYDEVHKFLNKIVAKSKL